MRRLSRVLAALALLVGAPALAQQGSKVHMHGAEGYAADGFLFEPTDQANGAAVLVIHGARGLSQYVLAAAQHLSMRGFVTVAIDLSQGKPSGANEPSTPTQSQSAAEEALHDLRAAITFLRSQPNVHADAIGLEGWGLGGLYALRLASSDPQIRTAAVTLAQAPDAAAFADLHGPVLVNLPGTHGNRLAPVEKKLGSDFKIYSGTHGIPNLLHTIVALGRLLLREIPQHRIHVETAVQSAVIIPSWP